VSADGVPLPAPRPVTLGSDTVNDDPLKDLVEAASQAPDTSKVATQAAASVAVPAPATGADGYAVQFGASPAESEANALAQKLRTQNADVIGDHAIVVLKGDSGGKSIYRVRAIGYDKESAAAACNAAASAGLKCFPAKN
jgi:cell division septation protein DedD